MLTRWFIIRGVSSTPVLTDFAVLIWILFILTRLFRFRVNHIIRMSGFSDIPFSYIFDLKFEKHKYKQIRRKMSLESSSPYITFLTGLSSYCSKCFFQSIPRLESLAWFSTTNGSVLRGISDSCVWVCAFTRSSWVANCTHSTFGLLTGHRIPCNACRVSNASSSLSN